MPSKEVRLLPRPTLDSRGPRAPGWGLLRGGPTRMVGETGLPALALAPPLPRPPSPKPPRESLPLGAGPGGGGMGRHRPAPAKVPPAWTPGASGLRAPVSVWGGARRGRIPAPPQHSVHFLPWLQISTASFAGHLRPLPAAWPRADPRGDRWSLSCPLRVWSQLCPQPSALPRGPGREQGVSRRGGGDGAPRPAACSPQRRTRSAYCVPGPGRCGTP